MSNTKEMHPDQIIRFFGVDSANFSAELFGNGLIHSTYMVKDGSGAPAYILQHVNHHVFKKPLDISDNLEALGQYLKRIGSDYFLPLPLRTIEGAPYAMIDGRYFRLTAYVPGSHAMDVCTTSGQAYEAALQFGKFTSVFSGFKTENLKETIPGFHDLSYRWQQFTEALAYGNRDRIRNAQQEIGSLKERKDIVDRFETFRTDPDCRLRVTHHDTKISNVLFNEQEKGICVIDLDTVMPGYFISDLGDMFRTYLSPVHEEALDHSMITVRKEFRDAIIEGYMTHMKDELTEKEQGLLLYAGEFMIYMQALRFLTDHINDDAYYGARYAGHNLIRARNQIALLDAFCA